jgi:hypothetical protein
MATLTIKYNPRNAEITKLLNAVTSMKGIEILPHEEILTASEMIDVEKSRKSGILYDMDTLKKKLNS